VVLAVADLTTSSVLQLFFPVLKLLAVLEEFVYMI
jgi:hypothetical protein